MAHCIGYAGLKRRTQIAMPWNASLDWAEEVFALWVVLPPVIIGVALLWYFAPRIGNK
jgi:ABC-type molybdate transport system permease subunit